MNACGSSRTRADWRFLLPGAAEPRDLQSRAILSGSNVVGMGIELFDPGLAGSVDAHVHEVSASLVVQVAGTADLCVVARHLTPNGQAWIEIGRPATAGTRRPACTGERPLPGSR